MALATCFATAFERRPLPVDAMIPDPVLTVPDGHDGKAVAWEQHLEAFANGQTRLIVRGRASGRWLDLARETPPAGHRRIFIERAYGVLARLPRPLSIAFTALGSPDDGSATSARNSASQCSRFGKS
jgi:hypothetical protein